MFALFTYIAPILTEVTQVSEHGISWTLLLMGVGLTLGNIVGAVGGLAFIREPDDDFPTHRDIFRSIQLDKLLITGRGSDTLLVVCCGIFSRACLAN